MSTLFDIFGAQEFKASDRVSSTASSSFPVTDLLPGKQNVKSEPKVKGKRVLGDVGNKIHTGKSQSVAKISDKTQVLSKFVEKVSDSKEKSFSGKKKSDNMNAAPVCQAECSWAVAEDLPEVQTIGPDFWDGEDDLGYNIIPSKMDFISKMNFWDIETRCCDPPEFPMTPWDDSMNEPHIMLDVSLTPPRHTFLEAPDVTFPWE